MRFDELFIYEDGEKPDDWMYCIHCECVSRREKWERADGCPRKRCSASPLDAWPWSHMRRCIPEYPETPEDGRYYPMYPPASGGNE